MAPPMLKFPLPLWAPSHGLTDSFATTTNLCIKIDGILLEATGIH